MEHAFRSDFSDVRVHHDATAQTAAESLSATAFTHGEDIYLGAASPAPDSLAGRALVAHELAHVVQQRHATKREPEVSQLGDRFEQAADHAAHQAVQGQSVESTTSGAPPAVQRQPQAGDRASRQEAQAALEAFLRRVMQQQGGRALRVTPEVRSAITSLFSGDIGRLMGIEAWLSSPALPGDPAEFAQDVAQRLPETIDRARIESLNRMSGRGSIPSLPTRVRQLVESTAPGKPERPMEPPGPTSEKRAEQTAGVVRALRGEPEPEGLKPVSIDVLHAARIARGLPGALRAPQEPRTAPPEARTYPEVERVIQQVAPDALTPAEARGTPEADSFAEARQVARDLASRLDVAQQQRQESIELRLGDNYNGVRDRAAMITELERIIQLVRDALPHHAAGVVNVDVFFGERWASRGSARRSP